MPLLGSYLHELTTISDPLTIHCMSLHEQQLDEDPWQFSTVCRGTLGIEFVELTYNCA